MSIDQFEDEYDDDLNLGVPYEENKDEFRLIPPTEDIKNRWKRYLPIVYWFPRYNWSEWFPMDLIASITDIVMVIPQSMGYALVAGLQPIQGLYSALMGHCFYSPFGTSGQLIVAPVAIVSLMTKETLHAWFPDADYEDPVVIEKMAAYASALAFQSGVICLILGFCKAGVLANMLAEPVIVGFTFAAAILIGISQLTFIFNIHVHGEQVIDKLVTFFSHIGESHGKSVGLAVGCAAFLLIVKYWGRSSLPGASKMRFVPSALILVVMATLISAHEGSESGFDVVGSLPNGLPQPKNFFNLVETDDFWRLWIPAFIITLLSFIESIAVATKFADKHGYQIDASQELLALGACNLIGCFFQIYPVSGVLSLATVVEAAGATTPLYGMMSGLALIIVCASALSLFKWLPKPVLGAIVLVGIMGLMDINKMKKIWKLNKRDFVVLMLTILITLFLGIDFGVMLGVVASIVIFIQRGAKPHYSVLGRVKDCELPVYRNVKHYPETTSRRPDMLMIRWDAPIFFANVDSFKTRVKKQINRYLDEYNEPKHWCLVFDFSAVNDVDFTGIEMLEGFVEELHGGHEGMTLLLTKLKTPVLNALTNGGIIDEHLVPNEHVLWELHEAETWWDQKLLTLNYGHEKTHYSTAGGDVIYDVQKTNEDLKDGNDVNNEEEHDGVYGTRAAMVGKGSIAAEDEEVDVAMIKHR